MKRSPLPALLLLLLPVFFLHTETPVRYGTVIAASPNSLPALHNRYRDTFTRAWFKQALDRTYALWKTDRTAALVAADRLARLAQLTGNGLFTASMLHMQGDLIRMNGWKPAETARRALTAAIKLYDKAGKESLAGAAALTLGHLEKNRKQYRKAALHYFDALARYRRNALWGGTSDASLALGRLRQLEGNNKEASGFFRLALKHAYQARSNTRRGAARVAIGDLARAERQFEKAIEYYRRALTDYGGDLTEWMGGRINHNIGVCLSSLADFSGAVNHYQQALIWYRRAGSNSLMLRVIISLGDTLRLLSRIEEARQTFLFGIARAGKSRNLNDRAGLHLAYGRFSYWTGEYDTALKQVRKAREEFGRAGNSLGEANCYQLNAYIAGALGRTSWQQAMLRRALAVYRKQKLSISIANTLNLMAGLAIDRRDLNKAESLLKEALPLFKKMNAVIGEGNIYDRFSFLYMLRKQYPLALQYSRKAAVLFKQVNNKNNLGNTYHYQAAIHERLKQPSKAVELYRKADTLYKEAGIKANRVNTLNNLFHTLYSLKRHAEGDTVLNTFLQLIMALRQSSGNERMRYYYQEKTGHMIKNMVLTVASRNPTAALNIIEQFRGRTFLENLQGRRALRLAGIPEPKINKWKKLQLELASARITLQKLPSARDSAARKRKQEARRKELQIRRKLETLEQLMARQYPRYARLRRPVIPSVAEAGKGLRGKEALLVYLQSGNRLGIWLVTGKTPLYYRETAFTQADDRLHVQYREALTKRETGESERDALAVKLFGPVAAKIPPGTDRLNIIPDGRLAILPWTHLINSLPEASRPGKVVIHPTMALFTRLRAEENSLRTVPHLPILVFGGARYQPSVDPAITNSRQISPSRRNAILTTRGNEPDEQWGNLPGTVQEGQDICRIWYKDQVSRQKAAFFYDLLASEAAVKTLNRGLTIGSNILKLTDARILHFAVHGKADQKAAETSRLILTSKKALSPAERQTLERWFPDFKNEDGSLNAAEILSLEINADLVVLSACQTGMGKISSTEGIMGLTRSWFIAGARGVLVSLWNVSDVGTRVFMTLFHRRLSAGETPESALGDVINDLRTGDWRRGEFAPDRTFTARGYQVAYRSLDLSSPYFWAAFQYWGR